jgi:hypothetical protein
LAPAAAAAIAVIDAHDARRTAPPPAAQPLERTFSGYVIRGASDADGHRGLMLRMVTATDALDAHACLVLRDARTGAAIDEERVRAKGAAGRVSTANGAILASSDLIRRMQENERERAALTAAKQAKQESAAEARVREQPTLDLLIALCFADKGTKKVTIEHTVAFYGKHKHLIQPWPRAARIEWIAAMARTPSRQHFVNALATAPSPEQVSFCGTCYKEESPSDTLDEGCSTCKNNWWCRECVAQGKLAEHEAAHVQRNGKVTADDDHDDDDGGDHDAARTSPPALSTTTAAAAPPVMTLATAAATSATASTTSATASTTTTATTMVSVTAGGTSATTAGTAPSASPAPRRGRPPKRAAAAATASVPTATRARRNRSRPAWLADADGDSGDE